MSALAYGLDSLDIGVTNWRLVINTNLSSIYTAAEMIPLLAGKAPNVHIHTTYWPVTANIVDADMAPVLGAIVTDVAFDSTHNPLLIDRTTGELYRLEVTSAAVVITATGVYANFNPNTIDNEGPTMNALAYPSILNGDLI